MFAGAAVAVAAGADFVVEGAVDFVLFGTGRGSVSGVGRAVVEDCEHTRRWMQDSSPWLIRGRVMSM